MAELLAPPRVGGPADEGAALFLGSLVDLLRATVAGDREAAAARRGLTEAIAVLPGDHPLRGVAIGQAAALLADRYLLEGRIDDAAADVIAKELVRAASVGADDGAGPFLRCVAVPGGAGRAARRRAGTGRGGRRAARCADRSARAPPHAAQLRARRRGRRGPGRGRGCGPPTAPRGTGRGRGTRPSTRCRRSPASSCCSPGSGTRSRRPAARATRRSTGPLVPGRRRPGLGGAGDGAGPRADTACGRVRTAGAGPPARGRCPRPSRRVGAGERARRTGGVGRGAGGRPGCGRRTTRASPARQAAMASRSLGRARLVPVSPWST